MRPRSTSAVTTSAEEVGDLLRMSRHQPEGFVPVIGAGVAIAAAARHELPSGGDWAELLSDLTGTLRSPFEDIGHRPESFLAAWERMVTESARVQGMEPFQAEYGLHKHVTMRLRQLEVDAGRLTLYQEFIKAGFPDIVSLNFDRRLALSIGKTRFIAGPKRPPEGPSARTLYRHDVVTLPDGGETRVWYPHGDTRRADTLRLGVRKYGFHLGLIRERLGMEGNTWRERSWGTSDWEAWAGIKAGDDEGMDTWVDVAMARPLVFLGCGLGSDEWSIWWLLRARCRDRNSPPALVAHVGLGRRRVSGRRAAALVLGNGVHVQAYGELDPPQKDPWTLAMERLVAEFDLTDRHRLLSIPRGHQVLYDELRTLRSDEWFRRRISEELDGPGAGLRAPLYSDLKGGEFEVILDLSVCGTLQMGLEASSPTLAGGSSNARNPRSDGHARCLTSAGPTDVWQLYGSVIGQGEIRLGLFEQAAAIAEFEWIRIQLMKGWPTDGGHLLRPSSFLEIDQNWNLGFYRDMMLRPLVIVGTGIDLSDWSTWWLLHQRARLLSVFDPSDRPPTLVLTSRTEPQAHLAHDPGGISTLEFEDFGTLWEVLRGALSLDPPIGFS